MLPASLTKVYYLFSHWKPYSVLPPLAHQRSASVPDSGHIRKTGSGTSIGPVCKSGPAQTWLPDSGRILFAIWDPKLMCTLDIFAFISMILWAVFQHFSSSSRSTCTCFGVSFYILPVTELCIKTLGSISSSIHIIFVVLSSNYVAKSRYVNQRLLATHIFSPNTLSPCLRLHAALKKRTVHTQLSMMFLKYWTIF
ncbi:hypothetical protein GQR58_007929 [Nymphon striatum]|nr:hypothetical protein GQR58_007929 [Nymphon striatum]